MLIPYLIVAFISCCLASLFYWQVIQPVLVKGVRFRLFARRDELRRLAIEKKEDFTSFTYREAESLICKTLSVIPSVSLVSFVSFIVRNNTSGRKRDTDRFREEASPRLVRMMEKTAADAITIMMLNSPIVVFLAGFVVLIMWVAGKLNRLILYRKAENFIDDIPSDASFAPIQVPIRKRA